MLCPICHPACNGIEHANCQRSTVYIDGSTQTAIAFKPYYDEDGQYHAHNPNICTTHYHCSNGHRFAERSSWECAACGYKACEAEIVAVVETPPRVPGLTAPYGYGPPPPSERRTPAGSVTISAAQRQAINERKGRR